MAKALGEHAADMRRHLASLPEPTPRPAAVREQVLETMLKADQAFAAGQIDSGQLAELDVIARRRLANLQGVSPGLTPADRDAARTRVLAVLKDADAAFAAGKIDGVRLAQIDWHARRALENLAFSR